MPFPVFGPGILIVKRTDIANQSPVNIGWANELSLAEKKTTKALFGQVNRPLVLADGTIKATGKIKAAEISAIALNAVFYAESIVAGGYQWNNGESKVVPGGGGTVTVSQGAQFDQNLGVYYANNFQPLQLTTGAASLGYYSLGASGLYAFSAADAASTVGINYTSSLASGVSSMVVSGHVIGTTPTFQLDYWTNLNSNPFAVRLYSCVCSDLTQDYKLEDFMMPAIDFEYGMNAAQQVLTYVFPNSAS